MNLYRHTLELSDVVYSFVIFKRRFSIQLIYFFLQNLIEKEWLSFGHKFTDRCGLLGTVDPKETSAVFGQFLDSTWQLMQQFPRAFQFNERYLITLHDHVYSCQFGTFIGNCEKDRVDLR